MPKFEVYERQVFLVAYIVEAATAEDAANEVAFNKNINEYDYVVDSAVEIENVGLIENA